MVSLGGALKNDCWVVLNMLQCGYLRADETEARYRKNHSLPLIKLLQKASLHLRDKKAGRPAGRLGKAVRYLLNQGDDIETYIHHGQVEIDTGCGRATRTPSDVRPLAVGPKNWLFVGSPEAEGRSAHLQLADQCPPPWS
jgi:hypothetical protein